MFYHGAKQLSSFLPKETTVDIENTIHYIANIVAAFTLSVGINFIPTLPDTLNTIIGNVANAFIIFMVVLVISSFLNIINILYEQRPTARLKPIKGYIQIAKIALFYSSYNF